VPGAQPTPCSMSTGVLCRGAKPQGCEADYSPPSMAEVKNEWMCTSAPPICLNGLEREKCAILPFSPTLQTVYSTTILPILPRCESCLSEVKGKGVLCHAHQAQRVGRRIAVALLNPDNRSGSVVKATLRPLCSSRCPHYVCKLKRLFTPAHVVGICLTLFYFACFNHVLASWLRKAMELKHESR
jgi:hypothetical protein